MIHAVYDVNECTTPDPEPADLYNAMREAVRSLGCTILGELAVIFQPHGATFVLVLAESHFVVSTWPEYRLAHVDLFTCRADVDPERAITPVLNTLGGGRVCGQRVRCAGPPITGVVSGPPAGDRLTLNNHGLCQHLETATKVACIDRNRRPHWSGCERSYNGQVQTAGLRWPLGD